MSFKVIIIAVYSIGLVKLRTSVEECIGLLVVLIRKKVGSTKIQLGSGEFPN